MEVGASLFQKEMVLPTARRPLSGLFVLSLHLAAISILEKSDEPTSGEDLRWARRKMMWL